MTEIINVYTDGSCINNGKKNPVGGVGVFFSENDPRNLGQKYNYDKYPTNNKAELYAILEAIKILENDLKNNKTVIIHSDSQYSIKCLTKWYKKWELNNWMNMKKKIVKNKTIIQKILEYIKKYDIRFKYVKAHSFDNTIDARYNNFADELARGFLKT